MKNVKKVKKCLKVGCTVKNDHGTKRLHCLTFLRNLEHVYAQNGFYTLCMIHIFIQDNPKPPLPLAKTRRKFSWKKFLKKWVFFAESFFEGFWKPSCTIFQRQNVRESYLRKNSDTDRSFFIWRVLGIFEKELVFHDFLYLDSK